MRKCLVLALAAWAPALRAQAVTGELGARAVVAWFRTDPSTPGRVESIVRVTQPTLMGRIRWRRLRAYATASFEGLTIPGGEPAPGDWGEGFVDRRHPHTYVHELVAAVTVTDRVAVFVGKGFVPFGSDDPMSRPFVRFPVNHHLAQILERAVAGVRARARPLEVEAAAFDGDEPERPGQWPRLARFGDSWSVRATIRPARPLELSGSVASVASPEHRPGAGATQHRRHLGLRFDRRSSRHSASALLEWARSSELDGFFVFQSALAEGAVTRGRLDLHYRFERTDRPEEERLEPFRSARPHLENSILGTTRWRTHTLGAAIRLSRAAAPFRIDLLAEGTAARVRRVGGGLFDVIGTYGRDRFWTATFGVRAGWRDGRHRMGRYGTEDGHAH